MRRVLIVVAGGMALAGCQTVAEEAAHVAPLPTGYRQMITAEVQKSFFDPYSIRDAQISAPIAGTSLLGPVQTVCVRANAKNRMGGYTGQQATAYVFRAGTITTTTSGGLAAGMCASATYEPFPEIEAGAKAAAR